MQQAAASTRWCPTPEQLMILEEMYRTGIRTPNAAQIRQITAHLSYYGKIEGKNVFYWFQNHKARDRQKMRRRLSCLQQQQNGQAQAQAQALLSHQIFHLQLSPHPPVTPPPPPPPPPSLLPHLHFPYQHHLRRHHPSHFLHQAASGYYHHQEPDNIIPPVMNLVRKLESPALCGKEIDFVYEPPPTNTILGGKEMGCVNVSYSRPLKTLDLFPTSTASDGGLKDIDRIISSKSSSCSTSTTN